MRHLSRAKRYGMANPRPLMQLIIVSVFLGAGFILQHKAEPRPQQFRPTIEHYLEKMADSGFAFSVLVAAGGKVILQKGYGWTDSTRIGHASERTLFNIASITKSFTSLAVFLLREKHLLNLEDTIAKFFRDVPGDKRSITVAQLLTHTSGLAQNYAADGITDRDSAVQRILNDTLKFPPGTDFSYSNENYELLGAIIEVVTGESYEEHVRKQILQRAGMSSTIFWNEAARVDHRKIAQKNRALDPAALKRNWGYLASGGVYSTVADLHRWFNALCSGVLIDRKSLDEMWTVQRQLSQTGIGFGWFVSSSERGREVWTRGTEDWGHNGVVRYFPDHNVIIIVLSNSGERGDKNVTANRFISDAIADAIFK